MKKIIFKTLFKANRIYSVAWMAVTGKSKNAFREESKIHTLLLNLMLGGVRMNYGKYLGQIEKAHTKRKLTKLLELIGNDFAGISSRQYEELKLLILYKMAA